ncbi:RNA-directed DNA polymerase [Salinibacterium sp. UTAS2018]|uniref:antiviral reverse transcriptase Drt3a n=1 Tax=Salinibacterium sp. UTAS2018 TaxID=2508880 RepID=UPI001009552F|nr:antiviral reverse transcriptase Drt3a [Salinibacterium sp. UTAS2018]QAV69909.1 RNA-directed DNA polymerase [Salinibacterium sp. UTAS2018]
MSSLPYSVDALTRLSARKSRKGHDPTRIDPGVDLCFETLSKSRELYRSNRKLHAGDDAALENLKKKYEKRRKKLRKKRDVAIQSAIENGVTDFEKSLSGGAFSWGLKAGPELAKPGPGASRQTFQIPSELGHSLPHLQVSAVVRKAAKLTPQSRNSVVRALQQSLRRYYGHSILKLDIQDFFGSIPHEKLLTKLGSNGAIDSISLTLVSKLLENFRRIAGVSSGVPQGVGLSSQLAEFYLSDFDRTIRSFEGVTFYSRYVDDIVIVIDSPENRALVDTKIGFELASLQLVENARKRQEFDTAEDGSYAGGRFSNGDQLEYLGYRFSNETKKLSTMISDRRMAARKKRIELAFQSWSKHGPDPRRPNHGLDALLVDRLRYLAGNLRLRHSKSNVVVGIYFSNSALDVGSSQLSELDAILARLVTATRVRMTSELRKRIEQISFEEGFREKTFFRAKQPRIDRIVACWRSTL